MNLIDDRWIPVRDANGARRWIAPHEITDGIDDNPIMRLDAPRPDFNGALAQFLIGLVQTAWVKAGRPWRRELALAEPPMSEMLQSLFAPLRDAFALDGDGPRFMQDLTLGPADKPTENSVAALLIDSPGAQSLERNTDHFVKRSEVGAMCPNCAAAALFTLMTNAPAGGAGQRTSLRGGGPLTTLLVYDPDYPGDALRALWRDIAANVCEGPLWLASNDDSKSDIKFTFPWLAPLSEVQKGEETQPLDVHPLHVFWATPRRVRLDLDSIGQGDCDLCGEASDRLIRRYITKNYGLNYKGPWRHPLSPYYRTKPGEPALPLHPQPGGLVYRHWLGWVLGESRSGRIVEPATVVRDFIANQPSSQFRLWAFGYDMDNMKPRCWYETVFPLFELPADEDGTEALHGIVSALVESADAAARQLRLAIKDAWLGTSDARSDLGFIDASFWSATQAAFFESVRHACALAAQHRSGAFAESAETREGWLELLRRSCLNLFDLHAARGDIEAMHPDRLARAQHSLRRFLFGDKLRAAAALVVVEKPEKRKRGKRLPEET